MNSIRVGSRQVIETGALILQRTAHAEADWIVSIFTDAVGNLSAIAPGARKSRKRYPGGLEPFHTLAVRLRAPQQGDLSHLVESSIARPRLKLVSNLVAMHAAGRGLNWLRRAFPPMLAEPSAWILVQTWLDLLDTSPPSDRLGGDARLAEFGLRLLKVLGWSPEIQQCVRCGKLCPPSASAYLNLTLGGILCRSCGGMGAVATAALRANILALEQEEANSIDDLHGQDALKIVESTLESHAGIK